MYLKIFHLYIAPLWVLSLIAIFGPACQNNVSSDSYSEAAADRPAAALSRPVEYTYRVVHAYPHDPDAFTQGLVYRSGRLYESTGLRGHSSLREVKLETGQVLRTHSLPDRYFGEGIALFDGRIIQLTWRSKLGFVYDRDSFKQVGEFRYATEGWGITDDGLRLIMSDGSDTLYFWDPQTFRETGRIQVHDQGGAVSRLNELEYIRGKVYANVWQTEKIAQIDPATGRVEGWIDLSGLSARMNLSQPVDVLNGIAYDADNNRLFVTGKLWPNLFEIELIPAK